MFKNSRLDNYKVPDNDSYGSDDDVQVDDTDPVKHDNINLQPRVSQPSVFSGSSAKKNLFGAKRADNTDAISVNDSMAKGPSLGNMLRGKKAQEIKLKALNTPINVDDYVTKMSEETPLRCKYSSLYNL